MADTPTMPPLRMIADELYSLDPGEFVTRRDAWAKQARALKQSELAQQVKALRRPTVAASHLNRAVRAPLEPLLDFLDLGEPMRQAQAALSVTELATFGAQRRALEDQVIKDLVALLNSLGVHPSPTSLDEVRQTLTAALADPEAERVVRSGCLARPLSYAGFGPVDLDQALAADPAAAAPRDRSHLSVVPDPTDHPTPTDEPDPEQAREHARERAEQALARAQQDHQHAERAHDRATRSHERALQAQARAQTSREEAVLRRDQARADLEAARQALARAEDHLQQADEKLTGADDRLAGADQELDDTAHALAASADRLAEARSSRDLDSGS
ncbi:hypothetical protein ACPCG0_07700 [Propionibacteriaceae bacterium Y1923]